MLVMQLLLLLTAREGVDAGGGERHWVKAAAAADAMVRSWAGGRSDGGAESGACRCALRAVGDVRCGAMG